MQEIIHVDSGRLENFMADVFKGLGIPEGDAKICAEVLITADRWGIDSHGINRLKPIYFSNIKAGIQEPVTRFEIVRETKTTAVIDGNNGMGQVVGRKSMELAIEKAKEFGIGMVAVRNSNHYGIAGYYAKMACDSGMIGISGTNARPSVAPTFGVENMLGTNPLTFGLPTDEGFPFLIDCATSIAQRGKIEVLARKGEKAPEGWVIGEDGKPHTDSQKILDDLKTGRSALCPLGGIGEDLGGHKGYGYSTLVEILSASLQGGRYLKMLSGFSDGKRVPHRIGHFFQAIDVSAFTKPEEFRRTSGDILRSLRDSRKAPGQERIFTAGEKEYLTSLQRKESGIPLNRSLQQDIIQMKEELGLEHLPW